MSPAQVLRQSWLPGSAAFQPAPAAGEAPASRGKALMTHRVCTQQISRAVAKQESLYTVLRNSQAFRAGLQSLLP